MAHRILSILLAALVMWAWSGCSRSGDHKGGARTEANPAVAGVASGRVEAGLRVLTVSDVADSSRFVVYRGDYVRLETAGSDSVTISIPDLQVVMTFPAPAGKDFFKVPDTGSFPFTIGAAGGILEAVEFQATGYREVNAAEAAALIDELGPLVLDVRTPDEFAAGHLAGAMLIPVQVLEREIARLDEHRDRPVFVYCRSGNRSTVAAKMLMDRGFGSVSNLRRGIVEWERAGLPVAR